MRWASGAALSSSGRFCIDRAVALAPYPTAPTSGIDQAGGEDAEDRGDRDDDPQVGENGAEREVGTATRHSTILGGGGQILPRGRTDLVISDYTRFPQLGLFRVSTSL